VSPALPVLGACGRFRDENEGAILIGATNRSDVAQRVLEDLGVPDPGRPAPPSGWRRMRR
jgi:hypothetical protein